MSRRSAIVLFISVLISGGLLVAWFFHNKRERTASPSAVRNELLSFEDPLLGIAFRYPKTWGKIQEGEHLIGAPHSDVSGERIVLYFENLPTPKYLPNLPIITLTFTTPDFMHSGFYTGSRFAGQEDSLQCNEFRFECHSVRNGQRLKAMYFFEVNRLIGDFGYNTSWISQLINPNHRFKAIEIRFLMPELDYSQYQPKSIEEYKDEVAKKITEGRLKIETVSRLNELKQLWENITTRPHD